ncbi:hypothetical protein KAJ27_06925, partial [bacterium]|nr:hypothetical protein [bacterium]
MIKKFLFALKTKLGLNDNLQGVKVVKVDSLRNSIKFNNRNIRLFAGIHSETSIEVSEFYSIDYRVSTKDYDNNWIILELTEEFDFDLNSFSIMEISLKSEKKAGEIRIILEDETGNELQASMFKLPEKFKTMYFTPSCFKSPWWTKNEINTSTFRVKKVKIFLGTGKESYPYQNKIFIDEFRIFGHYKESSNGIIINKKQYLENMVDVNENIFTFDKNQIEIEPEFKDKLTQNYSLRLKSEKVFSIDRNYDSSQDWRGENGIVIWIKGNYPEKLGMILQDTKGKKVEFSYEIVKGSSWKIFAVPFDGFSDKVDMENIITYTIFGVSMCDAQIDFLLNSFYMVNSGRLTGLGKSSIQLLESDGEIETLGYPGDSYEESESAVFFDPDEYEDKRNPEIYTEIEDLSKLSDDDISNLMDLKNVD